MELWNDFEGKLLDGQYRLGELLSPKGRSAFFRTTMADGSPATVRVIESLNDEQEILARWEIVRGLAEPNLVAIRACGKTVLDGTHLVYALLEPTDVELSEVLRERALTPEETRQMTAAVVNGLEALHAHGLVHEHVEAGSVWASGETVKLRSDCVREAPEGTEGETLRRRDAHDLAMLVGFALTLRRDAGQVKLPRPFDDLLRNGMSGVWGLKEMAPLVRPVAAAMPSSSVAGSMGGSGVGQRTVARPTLVPGTNGHSAAGETKAGRPESAVVASMQGAGASGRTSVADANPRVAGRSPGSSAGVASRTSGAPAGVAASSRPSETAQTSPATVAAGIAARSPDTPEMTGVMRRPRADDRVLLEPEVNQARQWTLWAGVTAAVLLVLALVWHFARGGEPNPQAASRPAVTTGAATPASGTGMPDGMIGTPSKPSAASAGGTRSRQVVSPQQASVASAARTVAGTGSGQWRVVAFTFNREEQAGHKVATIAQQHPELQPEVFSPNGRSPYMVTLGGWMTVEQAKALRAKARDEGLPHDTYTQNYRGR